MLVSLKRSIYTLSNKIRHRKFRNKQGLDAPEKKLTIVFSEKKKSPFDIKSESSYNANLSNGHLELGLKKANCIAWTDIPKYKFQDHVIEAKIRLDSKGGYAAAGIIFRLNDDSSYYLALVSSKGYFRLDAVKDGAPRPLIAWTEVSDFNGTNIDMKIIAYGDCFIFIVNGKWLGEAADTSALHGHLGFALASYSDNEDTAGNEERYICAAKLDSISIDTRAKAIEACYKKWTDDSNINAEERLKLTETLAVMGESSKALDQLNKAWKRRDDAISSVATSYTEVRTRKELLLASRLAYSLEQYSEAEKYINSLLDQDAVSAGCSDSAETKLAYTEKLKILNELNKFAELKEFVLTHPGKINKDSDYYTLTARSYWELGDYNDSAEAWDKAFEIGGGASDKRDASEICGNAVYAVNAAGAHEFAGNKVKALSRYITAGKAFLKQSNNAEFEVLMPKLLDLGGKNWEARTLAGKWAFSVEDYKKSEEEFETANKLRSSCRPRPKADPAANYLWALILHLKGKNKEAIRLLEAAVKLAPDYGLFRFKLAEIKLKSGKAGSKTAEEFKLAIKNINDEQLDGKESVENMTKHAGFLLQSIGDIKNAKYFFDIINKEKN